MILAARPARSLRAMADADAGSRFALARLRMADADAGSRFAAEAA